MAKIELRPRQQEMVEKAFKRLRTCFHEYSPRTFAVRWLHEK